MTLRLVLVSLVAALGLTIPGTPVIESWVASTQDWMNARFADWDTRNLQSTDYVIASDHVDAGLRTPQASRLTVAVITPDALCRPVKDSRSLVENVRTHFMQRVKFVPKCSVFEPLEIGEKPATEIVFRLSPRNDRERTASMEGPPAPLSTRIKFDAASALGKASRRLTTSLDTWTAALGRSLPVFSLPVASHPKTAPDPRAKTSATELAMPLKSKTQELGNNPEKVPAPRSRAIALESFGVMEQSESLYFAGELPHLSQPLAVTPSDSNRCTPEVAAGSGVGSGQWGVGGASKQCAPEVASSEAHRSVAASISAVLDDVYEEITGSLRPLEDGFARPVAKPNVAQQAPIVVPQTRVAARKSEEVAPIASRSALKPRFEPSEVGESRSLGIAFPNSRNDGNKIAAVPAVATVPTVRTTKAEFASTRPASDLSRAVRLTREAVYAWVNVLAGPAIVTVSRPN